MLLSEINKELGIVIDNINLICEKSPEVCNHNSLKSPGTNSLKSRKMSISPTRNNNKLLRYTGAHNNSACKSIESGSIINLKSVEPIESIVSPQKKMPNEIRTPFDYATLYLMKNNINFIYDTFLTLQVFSSLRTNKIYQTLSRFNFESFLCYMITYIQPLAKLKNFKIEYNTDLSEEIEAIYEYYRVIIFNILVHIMNNTRNLNSEKHLKIKVEHNSYSPTLGSYYKIIFEFKDNDYIVPYDKLNEIFSTLDNTSLSMIDLEKMMIIDIGLIVTYFLCSTVYNAPHPRPTSFSAMSIDRSSHIIIVSIYVPAKKDIRINEGEGIVEKRFTDIKAASIEDKYYKKIVERLYQHVYDERIGDTRVSGNRSRYKKRSTVDKFKYTMYDDGKNECKIFFNYL